MNQTNYKTSPLDNPQIADFVTRLLKAGESAASVARQVTRGYEIQTSETSIKRFRQRHKIYPVPQAFTKIDGDIAEAASKPSPDPNYDNDIERMLRERGLDPEDWYVDTLRANEWGSPDNKLYQTRFTAKRKRPLIALQPVRSDGWKPTRHGFKFADGEPRLVVVCGDQQAPFHDERLHNLFCEWLEVNEPHEGVLLGDLGDFPDISRHPDDPENVASAQECLQCSYDILLDYIGSSQNTTWQYLLGNHDERIRQYLVKNAPRLYGLERVITDDADGEAIHSLTHLLRLDELGVELIEPHGTYENAQVTLSNNLAVRHGWIAQKGSGVSALRTLEQTGYSVIVGHTHRQSCVYHTFHEIGGNARQLLAVEAGCMCRLDGKLDSSGRRFPNYATNPDWQQGFVTATIYPDGKFSIDLAKYVNGVLLWREQRYE